MEAEEPGVKQLPLSERRILEALKDIPEAWSTTWERPDRERAGRHLEALRRRLDILVRTEDRYGDEQGQMHRNRAERNALHWVLTRAAEGDRAAAPAKRDPAPPSGEYIRKCEQEARELIDEGFEVTDIRRPCQVFHRRGEDIAPVQVRIPVWFFIHGRHEANLVKVVEGEL